MWSGIIVATPNSWTWGVLLIEKFMYEFNNEGFIVSSKISMPKPPLDFGLQTRSQAANDLGLLELSNLPHTPIF